VEKRQNSFERQDVLSGGLEVSPVAFKSYLEVKAVLWIRIRMFLDLQDPNPSLFVRIRILPSQTKNSKKNLDSYCFVTSI
jgi:hypothetical protein